MSRRVSFSPDQPTLYFKHGVGDCSARLDRNKKRVFVKIWSLRLVTKGSRFSPGRFFGHIGTKVATALQLVSDQRRCSRKVSSSSLARSQSYADLTLDSQRAEAIEDCIEFLNSSSSLQRSNSVSSSC